MTVSLDESQRFCEGNLSTSVDSEVLPFHRWYPIKEGFSPHLVRLAIQDVGVARTETVFDPFCGSGTVPVVAQEARVGGVGLEVNPFLAFVSRTKLLRPDPATVAKGMKRVLAHPTASVPSPLERLSTFSSGGGAEKWLFNRSVLRAFDGAWKAAARLAPNAADVIRLALMGGAMDCCNAFVDGKCLRYRKSWRDLRFGRPAFTEAVERRIADIVEDLKNAERSGRQASVRRGDSRSQLDSKFRGEFRLCVTSPPYLNSFDYSDVYRPELFLGGFVASNAELRRVRLMTVRSHVQVDWPHPVSAEFGAAYQASMADLMARRATLWNPKIPIMVQAYFEDLRSVLGALRRRSAKNGTLWVVVATSAYGGVEIPVDLILAEIGLRAGWYLREVSVVRYLRTSGQHWGKWAHGASDPPRLRESIVVFDAEKPARRRATR